MTDPKIRPLKFVERTQDHLNHYIDIADRKASILLTGHLAFLGLYANLVKPVLRNPTQTDLVAIGVTIIVALIAGGLALSVVYPRTPETPQGYMLWTTIVNRSESEYRSTMNGLEPQKAFDELVDENYALAQVASQKYQHFRFSLFATIALVLVALASYFVVII
jgi:hypothetical protein